MSTPKANGGNVQPWAPHHPTERGTPAGSLKSSDDGYLIVLKILWNICLALGVFALMLSGFIAWLAWYLFF